jgi:hypothetical protein
LPLVMAMLAAGPATEYSTKFTFFKPAELAVTVTVETVVGNCSVVRARPFASVTTEDGLGTAPLLAVKLTVTPGTDSQIKQSVITRDRKDQNPDAIGGITQSVQNEGRQKNSDQHVRGQRRPTGADVLQNLRLFELPHLLRRVPVSRAQFLAPGS